MDMPHCRQGHCCHSDLQQHEKNGSHEAAFEQCSGVEEVCGWTLSQDMLLSLTSLLIIGTLSACILLCLL